MRFFLRTPQLSARYADKLDMVKLGKILLLFGFGIFSSQLALANVNCNVGALPGRGCPVGCMVNLEANTPNQCIADPNYRPCPPGQIREELTGICFSSAPAEPPPAAAGQTPPPATPAASPYAQQVQACREATAKATDGCIPEKSSGMAQAFQMGSQMKQMLDMGVMTSVAGACSKMGQLSQAIDIGTSAFKSMCYTGYTSCSSSCEDARRMLEPLRATDPAAQIAYEEVYAESRSCNRLQDTLGTAAQGVAKAMSVQQMKEMCKQALSTNTLAEICKNDPNNPLCKDPSIVNCADPVASTSNTICICSRNPSDPKCGGNFGDGGGSSFGSNDAGGGTNGLDDFGGSVGGFDPTGAPIEPFAGDQGPGRNTALGSQGGRGVSESGGGPGGGGNGRGGAAGPGLNTKINSGYYGGGGNPGGFMPGSSARQQAQQGNRAGTGNGQGQQVDLRKFLPGGQNDPRRVLAGVSGPDGITGPHTDIWKKINTRYYSVSPSLLP